MRGRLLGRIRGRETTDKRDREKILQWGGGGGGEE